MISWHEGEYLIAHLNSFEVGVALKKIIIHNHLNFHLFYSSNILYYGISFFIG